MAGFDERPGDVRAPDRCLTSDVVHPLDAHRKPQFLELVHDKASSPKSAAALLSQELLQGRVFPVECKAQQVDIELAVDRAYLDAGDQLQAEPSRGISSLIEPFRAVMVGEREHFDAVLGGRLHDPGWRLDAVGGVAMEVEVAAGHYLPPRSHRSIALAAVGEGALDEHTVDA